MNRSLRTRTLPALPRSCAPLCVLAILGALATALAQDPAADAAVERALSGERITVELRDVPLENAVYRLSSELSRAVRVRWAEDVDPQGHPITLSVSDQPIGDVLREVLRAEDLDYVVSAGVLQIVRARERRCVELEESAAQFKAKGIRVSTVLASNDRCASRAVVHIGGSSGTTLGEGQPVDSSVAIGLIQRDRVIFVFDGRLFEVIGETAAEAPTAEPPEETNPRMAGKSREDVQAFRDLDLRVTGIAYSEDPRIASAIVNGTDVFIGDNLGGGLVVQDVRPNHVVFRFRGHDDWRVYNGESSSGE